MLDVLVNNAGIAGQFEQSALCSFAEEYQAMYDTNIFGVVRVTQEFIDLMKLAPAPRIVDEGH